MCVQVYLVYLSSDITHLGKLIEWINSSPIIQALATILGVFGVGFVALLSPLGKYIRDNIPFWLCKHLNLYCGKGYYSEAFMLEHIKEARQEIRVICVRNTRISSPDILRAFKEFSMKHNGKVELYYLDPSLKTSDDIIDKIRVTLPTPPASALACREEIVANERRMIEEIRTWDNTKRQNISLYRFHFLPSIHLCQFDTKIFLGFQFFNPGDAASLSEKTLNDYCILLKANSMLGKMIISEIDYLRNNGSDRQSIN